MKIYLVDLSAQENSRSTSSARPGSPETELGFRLKWVLKESNPVLNLGRRFETKALSSAYQLNSGLRLSHLHLQGIPLLEKLIVLL